MNALAANGLDDLPEIRELTDLEDPRVAASGILNALLEIDGHVSRQRQGAVLDTLAEAFGISDAESRELAIMGAWVTAQADTPQDAVVILAGRLRAMRAPGAAAVSGTLRAMIDSVMGDENGRLSRKVQATISAATFGHA